MGSKSSSPIGGYYPTAKSIDSTTQTTGATAQTPDPLAGLAYQQILQNAAQIANTPYQPYQGQQVAGFTADQLAAMQGYRDIQGMVQPYINQAADWTKQAVGFADPSRFSAESLKQYMNPYQQSVVDATLAQMKQNQDVMFNQNTANAIRQGAYGGSGQFLGQAEIARQQGLSNAQALAQLNAANYQQAVNEYNQQQEQAINAYLRGGSQYAGLGITAENARLQELGALSSSGALQQAQEQRQLDAAQQQWQQAKAYPYQQTSYFANLAQGLGPLMGQYGTTAQTARTQGAEQSWQPYQNQTGGGGIAGLITSGLGLATKALSGGLFADGGAVTDRTTKSGGGYMEHVGDAPYGEGPINLKSGFGPLMYAEPYGGAQDYIGEAEKTSKVMKPGKQVASERIQSAIEKLLNVKNEAKIPSAESGITSKFFGAQDGGLGEDYSKLLGAGADFLKTAGKKSDFSLGDIGTLFDNTSSSSSDISSSFKDGGRVGFADGGSFQEQYLQSKKAQQDAQDNPPSKPAPAVYADVNPDSSSIGSYKELLARAYQADPGPQLSPEQQGMPSMPAADYYSSEKIPAYAGSIGANKNIAGSMNLSPLESGDKIPPQYENFVKSLYQNYLGRNPEQWEIDAKLGELSKGTDPAKIEASVLNSPEGVNTSYIQNVYQNKLGRQADLGGLAYWKGRLAEGLPASSLADWFGNVPESTSVPAMFKSNAPVQGYFTNIADTRVNPYTGLYNLRYTAPYRGTTSSYDLSGGLSARTALNDLVQKQLTAKFGAKDGGRISKAAGGGLSGKSLYDYLISIGANPKEAAMLTGNAKVESSFNPYAMHDQNTGYGLWGHGKDRWADMQKFTGQRKPGWEEQAKFALWELRNSPKASLARQTLAKADSPQEVAVAGMHYERPQGYRPSTPWAGKNWQQRYASVAGLMGGKDIGTGSVLPRINPKDPSGPLLDAPTATAGVEAPRRPGLIPRLIHALAPISSAEAAEAQPSVKAEAKPMFAWPTLRNPRMNNLPDALGWNQQQAALPEWKKEVQTGFGPLQGEKPADEAQLLAEPTRRAAMGPEMPEEKVVAADRVEGKKSGKKYWGDWRDAEPWASDPIGGFFDTLTGDEKRADKPGKYEPQQGFDIGNLFGFAEGGSVRHHYAGGGGEDDLGNPLEELGSMIESGLGGLFGGEDQPTPAQSRAPEGAGLGDLLGNILGGGERAAPAGVVASDVTPRRGIVSPAISDALIAAGLGMMASPSRSPLRAIGEGGLKGFQVYSELSEQERKREEAEAQKRAAEAAAERYQRAISGEPPVAEDTETTTPRVEKIAPETTVEPPAREIAPVPKAEAVPEIDIESDPELRRLNLQLNRVASIPAPKGMESVKTSQLSNLKFQIEQRRRELESKVKAAERGEAAKLATPEAKARAKQLEVEQEALAKEAVGVEQEAKQADQRIATLSRMRDAVSSGKFRTGALAEKELALKKAVQSVFPSAVDEEAIAMAEQFDKDALRAVTDATGGKLGAGVSDSDVRFLTRQQAGLGTTKAGNVRTLEAAIKIEQRKKDIAQFARDYKKAHNGVLDSGYYQELQQWAEAHPMFVEEKGVKAEDTGKMTPDTVPEGHEIQRGEATYRWDSSSKKYKRVQ